MRDKIANRDGRLIVENPNENSVQSETKGERRGRGSITLDVCFIGATGVPQAQQNLDTAVTGYLQ